MPHAVFIRTICTCMNKFIGYAQQRRTLGSSNLAMLIYLLDSNANFPSPLFSVSSIHPVCKHMHTIMVGFSCGEMQRRVTQSSVDLERGTAADADHYHYGGKIVISEQALRLKRYHRSLED